MIEIKALLLLISLVLKLCVMNEFFFCYTDYFLKASKMLFVAQVPYFDKYKTLGKRKIAFVKYSHF